MNNNYKFEIELKKNDIVIINIYDFNNNYVELLAGKYGRIWEYRTFINGNVLENEFRKDDKNNKYYKKNGKGKLKKEKATLKIIAELVGVGNNLISKLDYYIKENNLNGEIEIEFEI